MLNDTAVPADNAIAQTQATNIQALAYAQWLHLLLVAGVGSYIGSEVIVQALILSGLVSAAGTASFMMAPNASSTRCTVASGYMLQAATLVFLATGHPWQIDMHTYFFVALAVSVATFDVKAIIAATVVTALHHIILVVAAPAWIFPGGTDFARLALHIVVFLIPVIVLMAFMIKLTEALSTASEKTSEASTVQEKLELEAEQQNQLVGTLEKALSGLADGDLTTRIDTQFTGQYQRLRDDFNASMEQLEEMISTIIEQASGIRGAVNEISQSSDNLSRRTENQAASLEETAAALDEITVTIETTASGAKRASEVVSETHTRAEQSGVVVKDAVRAMSEIEKSSDQISQIVSVIDEIAFQTNLLALNAGVEAARAGDAGRGFAVVAAEVRTLAQRSSQAAQEINQIISTSRDHVGHGVELVGRTGSELEEIVTKITSFSQLTQDITVATQEQASALAEVNAAVNQMSQLTQQNAAMAEESTAASHSLTGSAHKLSSIVDRFRTSAPIHTGTSHRQMRRSA